MAVTATTPAAKAAGVNGCVSMSTRLDPWGFGAMEVAARKATPPGCVGSAQAHPLTSKTPGHEKTAFLVTVRPFRSGVGHQGLV